MDRNLSGFIKHFNLCFEDEGKSYWFGMTWSFTSILDELSLLGELQL